MERGVGIMSSGCRLAEHDHVCWVHDDHAEFVAAAVEFLRDGIASGLRVAHVGSRPLEELRAEVASLGDVPDMIASGCLVVTSLSDMYPSGAVVDPGHQVDEYRRATQRALADGFLGLRVAADATALVVTAEQRDAFVRYEMLVDRLMTGLPFSAMCGYDVGVIGADGALELSSVHPLRSGCDVPFHVYAKDPVRTALAGDVDVHSRQLLQRMLDRSPAVDGTLRLDVGGLDFIDHRGLLMLDEWAGTSGSVVLERARPIVREVVTLLELRHVSVEAVA